MTDQPIYNPAEIEPRWQARWEVDGLYHADIDPSKPKHYALTMLPYPSGDLHIGHWYAMVPSDARARFMRMRGYNVMFPMGFDAFGLPAENAAIKNKTHPREWTYANIKRMRAQLRSMGAMYDWRREAFSKTPTYADELLDFSHMDWPERVALLQTNWIGRSEGAEVHFPVVSSKWLEDSGELSPLSTNNWPLITVFTTRADTLWGATFMVLAPEHPLVEQIATPEQKAEVEAYVLYATRQSDLQREATDKEKTGVFTGGYALNPVNGERIPIWIADYVLMTYGTGAIMAVPAHDERDFEFALKFGLPILPVIARPDGLTKSYVLAGTMKAGFAEAVQAEGIPFDQRQSGLSLTIPPKKVDRYIDLAQRFVLPDSWVEVVGNRWTLIFSDGVWEWDSLESEGRILERCKGTEQR